MNKVIPDSAILIPNEAKLVFQGQIFDVYQWPQKLFDDTEVTFEMAKRPDTVAAICVVDGKLLIIDDQQPHTGSRKSFPGGRVDKNDASIEAALKREIHEETGYAFDQYRLLRVWQPHSKMEWFVYLYLAWDVVAKDEPHLDPGELISVEPYSFLDVKTLILNKTGYLGDASDPFDSLNNLDELLALQEYVGTTVDR